MTTQARPTSLPSTVGIIGLGKGGGAVRQSLEAAGVDVAVSSSRADVREQLATAFATPAELVDHLAGSEDGVLLLAVPDGVIEAVATSLAALPQPPKRVVHMSGAKSVEALQALRDIGGDVGVLHPMAALQAQTPIPPQTLIAVEATSPSLTSTLQALAEAFDGVVAVRKAGEHVAYHAAAVVAGNLAFALLQQGITLMAQAGIDEDTARRGLAALLASTAERALQAPLPEAMTGPVARGDVDTVARHLEVLQAHPDIDAVYRALSQTLVQQSPADEAAKQALMHLLTSTKP